MQQPDMQAAIQASRKILVDQQILSPSVLQKPIRPTDILQAQQKDWRYFSLAQLFD
jgi:hypothetical protein